MSRLSLVDKDKAARAVPFRRFVTRTHACRIDLRLPSGERRTFPYMELRRSHYMPDIGIILDFIDMRVTIVGRNLDPLYDGIIDDDVGEVVAEHIRDVGLAEREPYIERIDFDPL